jgi:hypothetical protein
VTFIRIVCEILFIFAIILLAINLRFYKISVKEKVESESIHSIDLAQAIILQRSGATLIDVRPIPVFNLGHIPHAIDIHSVKSFNPFHTIVFYGELSDNSAMEKFKQSLQIVPSQIIYMYTGGWSEWLTAGLLIERNK